MILKVWWSEAGWKSILLSALYRQHVRGHNGPWDWYIVLILQTVGQAHRVWVTCLKSACWGLKVRTIWPMSLLVLLLLLSPHFCQVVHIFSCVKRMWMNYIIKWPKMEKPKQMQLLGSGTMSPLTLSWKNAGDVQCLLRQSIYQNKRTWDHAVDGSKLDYFEWKILEIFPKLFPNKILENNISVIS